MDNPHHSNSEIYRDYHQLDPSIYAEPDVLRKMLDQLQGSSSPRSVCLASAMALELAQHHKLSIDERYDYARKAEQGYLKKNEKGRYVVGGSSADIPRAHLPLYRFGRLEDDRSGALANASNLMREWRRIYPANEAQGRGNLGFV